MNIPWVKVIKLENSSRSHTASVNSKYLVRNIVGSSLFLVLFILAVVLILLPPIVDLLRQAFVSVAISATLLSGLLLATFLVSLPVSWFVRSLGEYRTAKALSRRGVVTNGSLMDKWMDEENGRPVYYVRYKHAIHLNAMQRVDRETFEQLRHAETLYILYMEDLPQVSCLDLD